MEKVISKKLLKSFKNLCPDGKEISSITISSGGDSVTLTPDTRKKIDEILKENGGRKMTIGAKTLRESGKLLSEILETYGDQIDEAYQVAGSDEPLSIGLNLKIKPGKGTELDLEASISFVKARVKDTFKRSVDENQMDLRLSKDGAL